MSGDQPDPADLSASSGAGGAGDGSSSSAPAPAAAAPLDPQLLLQLTAHLVNTVPNMVQGNTNVFTQHVGTAEAQVSTTHPMHSDGDERVRQRGAARALFESHITRSLNSSPRCAFSFAAFVGHLPSVSQ